MIVVPVRSTAASSLLALCLFGCGSCRAGAPPPIPIATTTVAARPLEKLPPPVPPLVARPEEIACTWTTDRWLASGQPTALRLRPAGPVFARIIGGRAKLRIPVGVRGNGALDVASAGLALTGIVDGTQVILYAAREFSMNDVMFPTSTAPLSYEAGISDGVAVTTKVPGGVQVSQPPLIAKRPCADVSLDRGAALNLEKAALGGAVRAAQILHAEGVTIDVFSDLSRPPDVRIADNHDMSVWSFGRRGAFTRVGIWMEPLLVAGWIKTHHLTPTNRGRHTNTWPYAPPSFFDVGFESIRTVACSSDIALIAEAENERATVGRILAQTPVEILEERGPWLHVVVESPDIHAADTAAFLVRASEMKGCRAYARHD